MLRSVAGALIALLFYVTPAQGGELRQQPRPEAAPPLALPGMAGEQHSLDDYRGKVVLVNFWGSWCTPCLKEIPSLVRLQRLMADKPFVTLAVNVQESPHKIRPYVQEAPDGFTVLLDRNGDAFRAWQVKIFPTSFLVDTAGRIRYLALGPIEWDGEEAVQAVESLLPKPAAAPR